MSTYDAVQLNKLEPHNPIDHSSILYERTPQGGALRSPSVAWREWKIGVDASSDDDLFGPQM